jgi:hypothetical protein
MNLCKRELVVRVARASGPSVLASRRNPLRATERSRSDSPPGKEDARPDFGGTPKSTRGTRVLP